MPSGLVYNLCLKIMLRCAAVEPYCRHVVRPAYLQGGLLLLSKRKDRDETALPPMRPL
jgi:hypothetical protein